MAIRKKQAAGSEFFKKVGILADLNEDQLQAVFEISKKITVPNGEIIMKEGDDGDSMFFFAEGVVDISKALTLKIDRKGFGSAEKSMVKLDASIVSFFGEMALFENEPRSATITAFTDCILYEIKREDFTQLCNEQTDLGLKILRRIAITLCHRIRKGNEDVLKLSTALSIALSK